MGYSGFLTLNAFANGGVPNRIYTSVTYPRMRAGTALPASLTQATLRESRVLCQQKRPRVGSRSCCWLLRTCPCVSQLSGNTHKLGYLVIHETIVARIACNLLATPLLS